LEKVEEILRKVNASNPVSAEAPAAASQDDKKAAKAAKDQAAKEAKEAKEREKKEKLEKEKAEKERKAAEKKAASAKPAKDAAKPAKESAKPAKEPKPVKEKPVKEPKPAKQPKLPEYITKDQFIDACSNDEHLKRLLVDSIFNINSTESNIVDAAQVQVSSSPVAQALASGTY
jgi:hypothetical protein